MCEFLAGLVGGVIGMALMLFIVGLFSGFFADKEKYHDY